METAKLTVTFNANTKLSACLHVAAQHYREANEFAADHRWADARLSNQLAAERLGGAGLVVETIRNELFDWTSTRHISEFVRQMRGMVMAQAKEIMLGAEHRATVEAKYF